MASAVTSVLATLTRPLTASESPHTYAALRIGLGALVIVNVSTLWPQLEYLYGDLGVAPAARVCEDGMARLSILCHLPASWGPAALLVVFTAVALAFTLGLATRLTGITTVVLYASIWWRSSISAAGDQVFADLLFILCFARCGEVWSLDHWLRRRRTGVAAEVMVPSWPRYLMIVQLALMIGVNGWSKYGATWHDGEAVFYALVNDRFHRFQPWALLHTLGPALTRALTWIPWLIERWFPLVVLGLLVRPRLLGAPVWLRLTAAWLLGRRLWATLAVGMLLGITALLDVGWFPLATAVAVLCLFRGDELARRTNPAPASPAPRTWQTVAIAGFMLWHTAVMTTRSLVHLTEEQLPAPIATAMTTYQRYSHTMQFWRMFSPEVAHKGWYLRVIAVTADGQRHDAPSDLDLLEHGHRITLLYDRRTKIYATMLERKDGKRREAHGRWVCRTWRGPAGEAARSVELLRIEETLPPPSWPVTHGPVDPHTVTDMDRREVPLTTVDCANL